MNNDIFQGKWSQVKGDVKKFFGKLTDDDMLQVEGNSDKMIGKLQERYGYTREQAEAEWGKFSTNWSNKLNDVKNDVSQRAADVKDTLRSKL